jgi:hypothetical protein
MVGNKEGWAAGLNETISTRSYTATLYDTLWITVYEGIMPSTEEVMDTVIKTVNYIKTLSIFKKQWVINTNGSRILFMLIHPKIATFLFKKKTVLMLYLILL